MGEPTVTIESCKLRGDIFNEKLKALKDEIQGVKDQQQDIRDDIKEVHDLQKQILYAIIGLFGASVLTLIGVIAGRAIDFKVFFP